MALYKRGEIWWMNFSHQGRQILRSTKTKDKKIAKLLFEKIRGEFAGGKPHWISIDTVEFDDLKRELIKDYKKNSRKSLERASLSVEHLSSFFGCIKVKDITSDHIDNYIIYRQDQGVSNGTINRELSALKRMFTLGARQSPPKVINPPFVPKLKEGPPREGFFEYEEYIRLRDLLPDYLKLVLSLAFFTGMRKREILSLTWDRINMIEKKIILKNGTTKNDQGRTIYLSDKLYDAILNQKNTRDNNYPDCPYVCFNAGRQIKNYQKAWHNTCNKAGLTGKLLHDNRRTAVRNMSRAGIPDTVIMKITGHITRSIFDRYNITSEEDIRMAADKVEALYKDKQVSTISTI